MKNDLKQLVDRDLSGLRWDERRRARVLLALDEKGGTTMKRKFTLTIAIALALMLTASVALAAVVLNYSPQASALTQARNALIDKYGLTHTTLGLFTHDLYLLEGQTVVVFHSDVVDAYGAGLTGEYTVTIPDGGTPIACWTFDYVDAKIYESGELDTPIWGQAQLEKFLQTKGEDLTYTALVDDDGVTYVVTNIGDPSAETELVEIDITAVEPREDELNESAAMETARAALMETFALTEGDLAQANFFRCELEQYGGYATRTWQINASLEKDGYVWNLSVVLDASTGEILDVDMSTGGNG